MKKEKFSLSLKEKQEYLKIIKNCDKKILALWAIDCAERVLPYFENRFVNDKRPRIAINTLKHWINTGIFSMKVIRKASLDSHKAAKEINKNNSACSAAHAAGQAVATAHVQTHSIGSALYALQAIYRQTNSLEEVEKERTWQHNHLLELKKTTSSPFL